MILWGRLGEQSPSFVLEKIHNFVGHFVRLAEQGKARFALPAHCKGVAIVEVDIAHILTDDIC